MRISIRSHRRILTRILGESQQDLLEESQYDRLEES